MIGGPHYISHEDEVGVVVVGGRVNMRDGPIRLFNGIELGLRNVTGRSEDGGAAGTL